MPPDDSDKAAYIALVRANCPDELKELPAWLCWRSEPEPGKDKPKKMPYYASGGARGAGFRERGLELDCPEDRRQLVMFEEAVNAYERGDYTGIGSALGVIDGTCLSGIDVDKIAPTDPTVEQVVLASGSYAEVSPSGNGVHVIGLSDIGTTKTANLEIYSGARFFTFTGQALNGVRRLNDLTAAAALARKLLLKPEPPPSTVTAATPVTEGRHNYLLKVAGRMRRAGLEQEEVLAALRVHNGIHCRPPRPDKELQELAKHVASKPAAPPRDELPAVEFRSFTLADLDAPIREETYLVPGMVPTDAYTLIAGALSSYKTTLLLNLIAWRATGRDLLGLGARNDLTPVPVVGDAGPALLITYEDTDWRIFARLQRVLKSGEQDIRRFHGEAEAQKFRSLATENIRRLPLAGTVGYTLVIRAGGVIQPNYEFLDELRAAMRAFTSTGLLTGLDPIRLALAGSQNDDDGADIVVQLLNELAGVLPNSALVATSHTSKTVATFGPATDYVGAALGTAGSALYSNHARSNFFIARLKAEDVQTQFGLEAEQAARQPIAKLTHGRLSHGPESNVAYLKMGAAGMLSLIEPLATRKSAAEVIDQALPLVARALERLTAAGLPTSGKALKEDEGVARLGTYKRRGDLLGLLEESGFILFSGATTNRTCSLTAQGQARLAAARVSSCSEPAGREI